MQIQATVTDTISPMIKGLALAFPAQMEKAVGVGGLALWHDIVHLPPKPHVDTGYTRGSISVHVAGKLINKQEVAKGQALSDKPRSVPNTIKSGRLEAVIAVNSPYAARLHELPPQALGPRSISEGGVGPKFVEAKLAWGFEKYARLIAKSFMQRINASGFSRGIAGGAR